MRRKPLGYRKWRKRGNSPRKTAGDPTPGAEMSRHPPLAWLPPGARLKERDDATVPAKCTRQRFLYSEIRAETRHWKKERGRKARNPHINPAFFILDTVDRPHQMIASDMTAFWTQGGYWEPVLYLDAFIKQIFGVHDVERLLRFLHSGWNGGARRVCGQGAQPHPQVHSKEASPCRNGRGIGWSQNQRNASKSCSSSLRVPYEGL